MSCSLDISYFQLLTEKKAKVLYFRRGPARKSAFAYVTVQFRIQ